MILVIEARANGQWIPVGTILPGQPPGSMSDNHANGRDIYMFGLLGAADSACIWRSRLGIDAEVGTARMVTTVGADVVAKLTAPGDSWEVDLHTDRSPVARHVRFTLKAV